MDKIAWAHGFDGHLQQAKADNAMDQYYTAKYIVEGKGTQKNPTEAFYWMQKSSENGYLKA